MKTSALAIALSALASLSLAAADEKAPQTPSGQAARNRGLYERYKDSVAVVRYDTRSENHASQCKNQCKSDK